MKNRVFLITTLVMSVVLAGACSGKEVLSREQMLDPETCKDCHPNHYKEWKSSMHAYAGDDPVFLAMNRRGQRETGGALGDFCTRCHAPIALLEGATTDGTNLEEVEQHLKGVTCYFCHTVAAVEGTHNNPLRLSGDAIMRAGIDDPKENEGHRSMYSPLHDRNNTKSSSLCGSCHDIMTDAVHLERTFSEFKDSIFSDELVGQSCSKCHMTGTPDVVADVDGVPLRLRHSHRFPGVDVALIDWPGKEEQLALIASELEHSVQTKLCFNPATNALDVSLTNIGAGHMFPSGSSQDRRVWVQLTATKEGQVVLQSGNIADGESTDKSEDPLLWLLHDSGFNMADEPEHMFWNITRIESDLLPPGVTFDPTDPAYDHSKTRSYPMGESGRPDRVEMIVKLRTIDLELIDELIASGDLDSKYRDRIPTHRLEGSALVWTPEAAGADLCVP